ncbi:protein ANTHESIS POMOTING FACTOR 1 isoform X3 [Citrus clementina]|uniref:protein ANTHESIS POMOTING FACTOR 1 isoform X3 n=1 Tax=Citrus clementina TaxID=85681 RepID=UPI000CED6508|nr:protein ANTHESIS POMOTING FACTOR 1 isoform X3 [Citrus x clementina]
MVGMNLYGFFLCTITSSCITSKVIMTGLFHLACAPPKIALSLVLLIELFCSGINRLRNARPATAYNDQGRAFAVAFGGYIRLFDARKYEGPFDIFSDGGDVSDANEVKLSNDGRLMLLTTLEGHIHVLYSFQGTLPGSGDGSVYAWSARSRKESSGQTNNGFDSTFEVASWMSFHTEPPVITWAPGSLMFVSDHLSYHFGILICLNWELTLGGSEVSEFYYKNSKYLGAYFSLDLDASN